MTHNRNLEDLQGDHTVFKHIIITITVAAALLLGGAANAQKIEKLPATAAPAVDYSEKFSELGKKIDAVESVVKGIDIPKPIDNSGKLGVIESKIDALASKAGKKYFGYNVDFGALAFLMMLLFIFARIGKAVKAKSVTALFSVMVCVMFVGTPTFAATVSSVTPSKLTVGTTTSVSICLAAGDMAKAEEFRVGGAGVSVTDVKQVDANCLTAKFAVDAAAPAGKRLIEIKEVGATFVATTTEVEIVAAPVPPTSGSAPTSVPPAAGPKPAPVDNSGKIALAKIIALEKALAALCHDNDKCDGFNQADLMALFNSSKPGTSAKAIEKIMMGQRGVAVESVFEDERFTTTKDAVTAMRDAVMAMETKVNEHGTKLEDYSGKITRLETDGAQLRTDVDANKAEIANVKAEVSANTEAISAMKAKAEKMLWALQTKGSKGIKKALADQAPNPPAAEKKKGLAFRAADKK